MKALDRRGFALLAVLWLITALSVLGAAALAVARTGAATTRNRVLLARAGWAREACAEILLARYADRLTTRSVDSVDLGRGTWCRASVEDPGAKLNVNVADKDALVGVLRALSPQPSAVSVVDSIIRLRPFADVSGLATVPGIDSVMAAALEVVLTTRGSGQVNLNVAPAVVIAAVLGISAEAVQVIISARGGGRPVTSADDLAARLSPGGRRTLYAEYQEFLRQTTFAPGQLVATVEGGVGGTAIVARETLTCVPLPERLAVVRREVE